MATTKTTFIPIEAIHPTELILDEIKARGIKKKELAERLGMQASNLSRFLRSKEKISPAMSIKLEDAFGIPADYWLGLQLEYERDLEAIRLRNEEETKAIQEETALSDTLNLTQLFKRLSIDGYKFIKDRLNALYGIFHITAMDELLALSVPRGYFKRGDKFDERNIRTWVLLAKYECSKTQVDAPFIGCDAPAKEIADLANKRELTNDKVKQILNDNGIGYSVVKKLDKAPIDGYATIINHQPQIVVTQRRNNADMLAFDVLHELCHIERHLSEGEDILSGEFDTKDAKEKEANSYAQDALIPPQLWNSILRETALEAKTLNPYVAMKIISKKAMANGISPSIALWRYKHDTGNYAVKGCKSPAIV